MPMIKLTPAFLTVSILIFNACDNPTGPEQEFTVSLSVSNLQHLQPGEGYFELWLSFPQEDDDQANVAKGRSRLFHEDAAFVSFGKFNLSEDNNRIVDAKGQAMIFQPDLSNPDIQVDINLAIDAIITLEPQNDSDASEPGSRLIAGDFTGTDARATATLTLKEEDALGVDYASTSAVYVLDTPTTATVSDFKSGIWWINPAGSIASGFTNLATLTDTSGWIYEGWVVDNVSNPPTLYSTGQFRSAFAPDNDRAGVTAGMAGSGFPFPGQDFIQSAGPVPTLPQLDNGNYGLVITLEPQPDNSETPFQLQILSDTMIGPNIINRTTVQNMENRAQDALPTAVVTIVR